MKDPHVEALNYRFEAADPKRHDFSSAAPLEVTLGNFHCRLARGRLRASPQEHFAEAQSAREELEPFLEAWSAAAEVYPNGLHSRFSYVDAKTIDRAPDPPEVQPDGSVVIRAEGTMAARASVSAELSIAHGRYPEPPPRYFAVTPTVAQLRTRFRGARQDRTWLLAAAYHALTTLADLAGGRSRIPETFSIGRPVVDRLARLASQSDPRLARKVKGTPQRLTTAEIAWLQALLQRIVIRVGEVQGGHPSPPRITKADLPTL
jgi:hypothetical protein